MRDVHSDSDISKVEAVAQSNQGQCDDVVQHQLFEILARLLKHQHHNQTLLRPVRCLQQVVRLEHRLVSPVREAFIHARGIEIPDWRPAHYVHPKRSKYSKVEGRVELFHEPTLLSSCSNATANGNRPDQTLHQELPRK